MIIVSFGGGLGNQMFQYAFYLTLKQVYPNTEIKADLMNVFTLDHDGYQLKKVFDIDVDEARLEDIIKYSSVYPHTAPMSKVLRPLARVRKKVFGPKKSYVYLGDNSMYSNAYYQLDGSQNYYLHGVWANSEYLKPVEREIRSQFVFNLDLTNEEKELLQKIVNTQSVSIHLRRGDYVNSDFYNLAESYYERAVMHMESQVSEPAYFVFSDDIDCAKKLFGNLKNTTFVSAKSRPAHYDMYFMSCCRHNIIANSTFSFWGAYLNRNPDKIVVCPDVWMPRLKYPLYCETWEKIENSCG